MTCTCTNRNWASEIWLSWPMNIFQIITFWVGECHTTKPMISVQPESEWTNITMCLIESRNHCTLRLPSYLEHPFGGSLNICSRISDSRLGNVVTSVQKSTNLIAWHLRSVNSVKWDQLFMPKIRREKIPDNLVLTMSPTCQDNSQFTKTYIASTNAKLNTFLVWSGF